MPVILRKTLTETFLERIKTTPNRVGFRFKPTYPEAGAVGKWKDVTYRQFEEECREIAFGLMSLGISKGDKVAILSNTRIEWALCDMAILGTGGVSVPIYASNTPDDCAYILNHCEAKAVFVENAKQLAKLQEKRAALSPDLKIIVIEPAEGAMSLTALKANGKKVEAQDPARFEHQLASAKPSDPFTICYTSGTTGVPKGAILTHDNMVSVLEDAIQVLSSYIVPDQESLVAFLPFSHVLGRVESMAAYTFGYQECYAESTEQLMTNIGEIKPTLLFAVPRVFEKAYARVNSVIENAPPLKKKALQWAISVGRRVYQEKMSDQGLSLRTRLEYDLARKTILAEIGKRFGGRLRYAVCGGAPLPQEIGEFFFALGIVVLEGYGLTETAAPCTLNPPAEPRYGTVGKPLPEVQMRIAEDGEILVRSRKVFSGYFKMKDETAEVLATDGWFHTGDIGHIDPHGYLQITDRKKSLIVTSGGKKIPPQKIENLAKSLQLVSQIFTHGDRRKYLTALVTLDPPQLEKFAAENDVLYSEYKELTRHPRVVARVQKLIDELNSHLAGYETIKKFKILPRDFSIEEGEMTPSLKLKRNVIEKRYQKELDSMY